MNERQRTQTLYAVEDTARSYKYTYNQNAARVAEAVPAEPRQTPKRQPTVVPRIVPAVQPASRPAKQKKTWVGAYFWATVLLSTLLGYQLIQMHAEMTHLAIQSSKMKSEITSLEKEQSAWALQVSRQMTQADIENAAVSEFGMVKQNGDNIAYLHYDNAETFEIAAEEESGSVFGAIGAYLKRGWNAVWQFIN